MTTISKLAVRHRPILVTGSHRSGTTWVGRMLASHPRVSYLQEPFNPQHPHPGSPVLHYFEHVTPERSAVFRAYLDELMRFRSNWWAEIRARPHPRRIAGASLRAISAGWRRLRGCRPLLKDPIALFSAEWIAQTYDAHVIVLVRHPAAFVSSVKRLGLRFGFGHLLLQPVLMERYLQPLAAEMRAFHDRQCAGTPDLIDEAALCWRVVHHVIHCYRREHPEWLFMRHEDLSRRPLAEFGCVFEYLQLPMTRHVRHVIESHSSEDNPRAAQAKVAHQLKLNSRANVWNWNKILTSDEIDRVRAGTEDVACHFYANAEWQVNLPASAA